MPLLREVEVFKVGTWNRQTFCTSDLDAMVRNFDSPVGINEEHRQPLYDFGRVVELQRRDDTLVATLDVPDDVAKEISLGLYTGCSVELTDDNVLLALALVISKRPAVAGLAPIGDRRGSPALKVPGHGWNFSY